MYFYYANMYSGNLHTTYNDVVWDMVYQEDTGYAMQMNGNTILDHVKDYFITDGYLYYTTIQEDGTYKYTLSDVSTSKIADISCTELVCVDEDIYFTESDRHTVGKLYQKDGGFGEIDLVCEENIFKEDATTYHHDLAKFAAGMATMLYNSSKNEEGKKKEGEKHGHLTHSQGEFGSVK